MSELIKAKSPNLGFGNMRMPSKADGTPDEKLIFEMVDTYMQHGYNYFDTAHSYRGSEAMLRKALVDRYPRESFHITTKINLYDCSCADDMQKQVEESLERLNVSYVDMYFLHGLSARAYDKVNNWKAFDYLRSLKEKGITKHIGFSFHGTADELDTLLTENPDMELVQLQINYLDWEDEKVQSRRCYEVCRAHNVPVSVMEPAKGGWLAGDDSDASRLLKNANPDASVASWAFRFVAALPGIHVILSGMGNIEQVKDNINTFENFKPLTEEERALTLKAVDMINSIPTVPCTGCSYCTAACPMSLPIPLFMRTYNAMIMFNAIESSRYQYNHFTSPETKASNCVGCRGCEERCPQGIEISKYVKAVSDRLEG